MTAAGEEKEKKGEATRERILNAALGLFAVKGFAETTMREIARESGCSLGLAYRYFASKDALALTLYERLVSEFEEEVAALPPGPLAARWAQAVRRDFARLEPHRAALGGLTSAGLAPGNPTQVLGADAAPLRERMLAIFGRIVRGARDAPAREAAEALAGLLYGAHLLMVLIWLQDASAGQRATRELIDFGEETLGRLRLALRLPWLSSSLVRLGAILLPLLGSRAVPPA